MTKIDIFSGFLGAGKTTLIKKLLKEALQGQKIVLIENEFGEIGIDGGFLKEAGIQITEMNSGCICCSLVGDFGEALKKVLDTYAPERILIEPSGVGKLSDVISAVGGVVSHREDVELGAFVTIVDATKAKMYIKNFGEFFNNQIENAKTIILSRTQKVSQEKLDELMALLREHNADATIVTTPWDEIDGKVILSAMQPEASMAEEMMRQLREEHAKTHHHHHHDEECDDPECECHHHHHDDDDDDDDEECECHHHHHHDDDDDDEDEHEHHHHHHHDDDEECDDPECECHHHHDHDHHHHHHHGHDADEVFISWGVETPRKYDTAELQSMLEALDDAETYGLVLRAKGIVPDANGGWLFFDMTPGEAEVRTGAADYTGKLCVIGSKLNEEALATLFKVNA
ncbi:MAG: GTP-binding protein [Lachnospiraceae bacterium]|nr:GTP-binding protein [Lachnospiraceae bacterium]